MKFCPNCGFPLEGKEKCDCGYDSTIGEVDEKIYKDYKNNEKSLYEQSCDNISLMGKTNPNDIFGGAKMMGINPNLSDEEILNQIHQPIFNRENDNLTDTKEIMKIMFPEDKE